MYSISISIACVIASRFHNARSLRTTMHCTTSLQRYIHGVVFLSDTSISMAEQLLYIMGLSLKMRCRYYFIWVLGECAKIPQSHNTVGLFFYKISQNVNINFFTKQNFYKKTTHSWSSSFLFLCCYLFCSVDSINNTAGNGFSGYDSKGAAQWDLTTTVDPVKFESGTSLRSQINQWNITTSIWYRRWKILYNSVMIMIVLNLLWTLYVTEFLLHEGFKCWTLSPSLSRSISWLFSRVCYERVKYYPMYATFFLSAWWHGFYPGYYVCFMYFGILTGAARKVQIYSHDHKRFVTVFYVTVCSSVAADLLAQIPVSTLRQDSLWHLYVDSCRHSTWLCRHTIQLPLVPLHTSSVGVSNSQCIIAHTHMLTVQFGLWVWRLQINIILKLLSATALHVCHSCWAGLWSNGEHWARFLIILLLGKQLKFP